MVSTLQRPVKASVSHSVKSKKKTLAERLRSEFAPQQIERANRLALANEGLTHHVAHRFTWTNEEHEDLAQIAFIGLRMACLLYDPNSGKRLSSFAVPYCSGAILHHIRDHGSSVKVPRAWRVLRATGLKAPPGISPWQHAGISEELWLSIQEAHAHQWADCLDEQTAGELEADETRPPSYTEEESWAKIKVRIRHLPKLEYAIAEGLVRGMNEEAIAKKLGLNEREYQRRLKIVRLALR